MVHRMPSNENGVSNPESSLPQHEENVRFILSCKLKRHHNFLSDLNQSFFFLILLLKERNSLVIRKMDKDLVLDGGINIFVVVVS